MRCKVFFPFAKYLLRLALPWVFGLSFPELRHSIFYILHSKFDFRPFIFSPTTVCQRPATLFFFRAVRPGLGAAPEWKRAISCISRLSCTFVAKYYSTARLHAMGYSHPEQSRARRPRAAKPRTCHCRGFHPSLPVRISNSSRHVALDFFRFLSPFFVSPTEVFSPNPFCLRRQRMTTQSRSVLLYTRLHAPPWRHPV